MFKKIMLAAVIAFSGCATEDNVSVAEQGLVMPANICQHLGSAFPDDPNCVDITRIAPEQWNMYVCGAPGNCDVNNNNYGGNNALCASKCGLPSLASYGTAPHSTYNTAACVWADYAGIGTAHVGICSFQSKAN